MTDVTDRQSAMAARLSMQMKTRSLTQAELAELVGTSRQQIYKLERGIVRLKLEWAERLAPHLGCTAEWLLMLDHNRDIDGALSAPAASETDTKFDGYAPVAFIEIRAGMGGGGFVEFEHFGHPKFFEDTLIRQTLRARPSDLRAIEVQGQSMEPLLKNGDILLIDARKIDYSEPGVFVLFDGDGVVCKWIERVHGAEPRKIRIKSENKRFSDYEILEEESRILGRVVWFSRAL